MQISGLTLAAQVQFVAYILIELDHDTCVYF